MLHISAIVTALEMVLLVLVGVLLVADILEGRKQKLVCSLVLVRFDGRMVGVVT